MPLFDFECQKCKTIFEKELPFGSKEMPVCVNCKSKKVEKIIAPPAIQFKGSGFYKTDSSVKPKESAPKDAPKEAQKPDAPSLPKNDK